MALKANCVITWVFLRAVHDWVWLFWKASLVCDLPRWLSVSKAETSHKPTHHSASCRKGFSSFKGTQPVGLFLQDSNFPVTKNVKYSPRCSLLISVYTVSMSDTDVAATWLRLYVHGCYSDTMVMSLHSNDASVGCLRSWDISGQWVE